MATPSAATSTAQYPASTPLPAGFDLVKAKALAPQVSADIAAKKYNYNRANLKAFQLAAGLTPDGIYGGGSRGALIFYGVSNPPAALFKPTATAPYPWTPTVNAQIQASKQTATSSVTKPATSTTTKPATSTTTKPATTTTVKPPITTKTTPAAQPVAASTLPGKTPPKGFDPLKAKALVPQVVKTLAGGIDKYSHALLKSFQIAAGIAADGLYGAGARNALVFFGAVNPPKPFFKPLTAPPYPWADYIAKALGSASKPVSGGGTPSTPTTPAARPSVPSTAPSGGGGSGAAPYVPAGESTGMDKTQTSPLSAPDQVDEYEPLPAGGGGPGMGQAGSGMVAPGAGADTGAGAGAPESVPASGGGGSLVVLALLGAAGYFGYKAVKGRKGARGIY